ncbi:MAG: GH116 family glycosyl hydrolase, partial [Candidatus Nezhaarchaeales archaeon]
KRDPSIQHNIEKFRKVLREIVKQTGKDPTGRVLHLLAASFDVVDNYDRSDLMPEYVLIALLNYYWTGDLEYLKQLWSSIKDVIEAMLRQHDDAGLKLPYHSPPSGYEGFSQAARELAIDERHRRLLEFLLSGPMYIPTTVNTFDALSLIGIATFTSDLWVASLKAAVVAAEKLGDNYADRLKEICREAVTNFVKCLWNGEYFDLWYDPLTSYRDEACMSAALTGEWYLGVLLGLGYAVDREKVVSMLRAVYKYNFKKWEGLLNATYPGKPRSALKGDMRYFNEVGIPYAVGGQMDTPWTGIEIPVAVHMIWEGMIEEGLRILRAVHERYASWGLYWNHIECDGHYFRVLCLLLIPNALAGARYIGTAKKLEISPRVSRSSFKEPVLAPGAVLSCEQEENEGELVVRLRVRLGRLAVNELELFASKPVFEISVKLNEKERRCSYNQDGSKLKVLLDSLELEEGDELLLKAVYE